jgi:Ca2+-binding EF-hand superfamily protein
MLKRALQAALLTSVLIPPPLADAAAKPRSSEIDRVLEAADPDKDGTLDLVEAKAASGALFDRLDKDKEGTVSVAELQGRLSRKDFKAGDPDNDGTLTKDEFLAIVEARFKAANPDADTTVDRKELGTPAGRALMRLLH